jgi:16S rRNA (uracil1498-N3)-methyltransferase
MDSNYSKFSGKIQEKILTLSRFYCPELKRGPVELDQTEAHHLIHVMRMGVGDKIELFDGNGRLGEAVISKISRKITVAEISNITEYSIGNSRVIIAASIPKGPRFDWMISKCTELGVDHIVPVLFERTIKQAKGSSAIKRAKTLAITAAKQCRRLFLPKISEPTALKLAIEQLKEDYPQARFLYGGFGDNAVAVSEIMNFSGETVVFIGPEGGMTENEEKLLDSNGAKAVSLTSTVLRIETAAIAFSALLCAGRVN